MILSEEQANIIEKEIRKLESDPTVSKQELRLFMQHPMPCGHAAGNLLTCSEPPIGCVICGEPAPLICPKCGKSKDVTVTYCENCGWHRIQNATFK